MKQVAGKIKGELAQYREMAAFAQFGSDLDATTQRLLNRGARLTELLKQDQFQPLRVAQQIAILFAGTAGYFDELEVSQVREFEAGFYDFVNVNDASLWDDIESTGQLDDALEARLRRLLDAHAAQSLAGGGAADEAVVAADDSAAAEAEAEEAGAEEEAVTA